MMRRNFIKAGMLGGIGCLSTGKVIAQSSNTADIEVHPNFTSDGLGLSPIAYAKLLTSLCAKRDFEADTYILGKVVHSFEEKMAKKLGKEKAVYMPTGTLANHIALRLHCVRRKKVLIQQQSHIYRDSGDALPQLSGINLLPLAVDGITFELNAIKKALTDSAAEKVYTGIEAISIETPVRRKSLRRFDFESMKAISGFAKSENIKMHLDGARVMGEAALQGRKIKEYTDLFDTVYISLYKYFNSIAGAILAGPAQLMNDLHNERRMFGGGLRSVWENVIVSEHFFDGFEERFQAANKKGMQLLEALKKTGKFDYKKWVDGTNVVQLKLIQGDANHFSENLKKEGIAMPSPKGNTFTIKLNESLNYFETDYLVDAFNNF